MVVEDDKAHREEKIPIGEGETRKDGTIQPTNKFEDEKQLLRNAAAAAGLLEGTILLDLKQY